jgi:hypothetical protein
VAQWSSHPLEDQNILVRIPPGKKKEEEKISYVNFNLIRFDNSNGKIKHWPRKYQKSFENCFFPGLAAHCQWEFFGLAGG